MIISQPDITLNILPAQRDIDNTTHRVLIVGQMLSGTATSGAVNVNVGNDHEEDALFGRASHVAALVRQFRRINPISPIDVVGYTEALGVKASGTVVFTGPATAAGTIYVTIGSDADNKYAIAVASGDTATTIGDALVAAMAADTTSVAVGVNTTGSVAITHKQKGTIGNQVPIKVTNLPAGVGVTITGMSSGATDPTITGLEALIDGRRYHSIVFPGTWSLSTLGTILTNRLNATNAILDGMAIVTKADTYSNLLTYVSSRNNPLLIAIGNPLVSVSGRLVGGAIVEISDNISAQFAAIRALRLTRDSNLSRYVIGNNGPKDVFGGPHLASLPYFNTPFYNLPLIQQGDGFTRTQIEALQLVGVSVLGNNVAGNMLIAGEIVTTYLTDVGGNADSSFKYAEYVDTISNVREYIFNNLKLQYAQSRLTDGALTPGYNMANADSIKAYITGLYITLSDTGYVLTRGGESIIKYFKDNLTVSLNLETGAVTIGMIVPIVVQLRTIFANIRLAFNTNN